MELERRQGERLVDYAKRRAEALGITVEGPAYEAASARVPAPAPTQEWDDDLIPDAGVPPKSAERLEMDAVLDGLDVLDAYRRWCGKMEPSVGKRRSNIMISCPVPGHADTNPSADLNLDKGDGGVWHCHACDQGGDKYDIAAWHFGFDVPGYKDKDNFPELRRQMAEDLGYHVVTSGKDEWLETPPAIGSEPTGSVTEAAGNSDRKEESVDSGDAGPPAASVEDNLPPDPVFQVNENQDYDVEAELDEAWFDWRTLGFIEPTTFLAEWMEVTSQSYEPEEFYFWEGLLALGSAVGNGVIYQDTIPVRPNLMVCAIGTTGAGKSISISILERLIRDAMPWDPSTSAGVRLIKSPGSGEALLDEFAHYVTNPNTGDRTELPVNGLYRENEFAALAKRTQRQGNTMREILMDMYDRDAPVSATSRGAGSVTARGHFMNMVTSTQPGVIGDLMSRNDSAAGYLNRWTFIFGRPKFRPSRGILPLEIDTCIDPLRKVRTWGATDRQVDWKDQKAGERWDEFYADEVFPLTMDEENWMAARIPLLVKKMMLLFAINDKSTTILPSHVEGMIRLWPYLLRCYGIVEHRVAQGADPVEACTEQIVKYLRDRPGTRLTFREISKQSAARQWNKETIRRALDLLVKASMVEESLVRGQDRAKKYAYIEE